MLEASNWWIIDLLIIALIMFGLIFLKAWFDARRTRGKMLIDMREPTGFTDRHLVKPDENGDTVTFENGVYALTKPESKEIEGTEKETEDEEIKSPPKNYPRIRFVRYPKNPFLGLSMLQTTLRLEEYQRGNPEPIHPFYGRVDKDGKFIDSQLTVTSIEWQSQKSTIQATAIAMSVQEREAREKEWAKGMANLPNKMIVYLGLGLIAVLCLINLLLQY